MKPIFLYGTLCHAPLRAIVLGAAAVTEPARLEGHAVFWASGESYPILLQADAEAAEGELVTPPSKAALARMDYYEAAFGYRRVPVEVRTGAGSVSAEVYRPQGSGPAPGAAWSLGDWAARWGDLTCATAEEIMEDMECRPSDAVARRFPALRARAQARLNARMTAPTTLRRNARPGDVVRIGRKLAYANFFSVEEYDLTHVRFAGGQGAPINRTAFVSGDAVTVLPYDPLRDTVLLVEQFRTGAYARGDAQPWLLEAVAGRIDGGETPEEAALRETREEAGLEIDALHRVGGYYPTPGAKTEYLFAFVAVADLPTETPRLGGLAGEGEDIRSHVVGFDRAMALIETGEINVGPLILLLQQLDRMRPGLRAAAAAG